MIKNNINDKSYVGQSINIENRWTHHKSELNNNKHINDYLQNAWNKYGEHSFEFIIIEECTLDHIDEREIYWIDYYKTAE